ncbi:hypothetical protein MIR68_012463 [Amoeboaphelidium protococcarum]|nr:hypothetical protein MIR68_012463 [Amoeboaphelidium protococcarum]
MFQIGIALVVVTGLMQMAKVDAHARLVMPVPFNTNPTRATPCGGQDSPLSAAYIQNFTIGSTVTLNWQLIASDGSGPLTVLYDQSGGVNFQSSNNITVYGNTPQALGDYSFTMTVPNITCGTGNPNVTNYCTAQVKSSSGWVSCFAFQTGNFSGAVFTPPPTTYCTPANQLSFCTSLNNQNILVPTGSSATLQDGLIRQYYDSIVNNTNVFSVGGQSFDCQQRLRYYLCQTQLPYCGRSSYLNANMNKCYCQNTMGMCGLTEQHRQLFNCTTLPDCPNTSDASSAAVPSIGWVLLSRVFDYAQQVALQNFI